MRNGCQITRGLGRTAKVNFQGKGGSLKRGEAIMPAYEREPEELFVKTTIRAALDHPRPHVWFVTTKEDYLELKAGTAPVGTA